MQFARSVLVERGQVDGTQGVDLALDAVDLGLQAKELDTAFLDGPAQRLDVHLVRAGLARSRGEATQLVRSGAVTVNGGPARRASHPVEDDDAVEVERDGPAWVGRGAFKLEGALAATRDELAAHFYDGAPAPTDADNGDPTVIEGVTTHVSAPERAAFQALLDAGLHDTVRPLVPTGYTYWDYKQLRFPRNEGMRIDFILGSHAFADAVVAASIHRDERKGEIPSDHVPVVVDLDLEGPDDDDRPMIF